jgi:hypothetical protein
VLSAETAAPAIAEARRKAEERRQSSPRPVMLLPTEKAWREAVANMRDILTGDDIPAARECLRELIGPIRCKPAEGAVLAEMTTRSVFLATGTGGRGLVDRYNAGPRYQSIYQIKIPTSTRGRR